MVKQTYELTSRNAKQAQQLLYDMYWLSYMEISIYYIFINQVKIILGRDKVALL